MARAVSRYDEGKVVCCIREDFALVHSVFHCVGGWQR